MESEVPTRKIGNVWVICCFR